MISIVQNTNETLRRRVTRRSARASMRRGEGGHVERALPCAALGGWGTHGPMSVETLMP